MQHAITPSRHAALQRRVKCRAVTDVWQVRKALSCVRQMADIAIAQFDALDQSSAPVQDKQASYADLARVLAKAVRELCLELPAAKDHPDVLHEVQRAQCRATEGARRLAAMQQPAAAARPASRRPR